MIRLILCHAMRCARRQLQPSPAHAMAEPTVADREASELGSDESSEDTDFCEAAAATASSFDEDDSNCVVCFERAPETTLEPCGHANLCLTCVSRLAKRRCPTCRARAKKVRVVDAAGVAVTKAVKEVINERKNAEMGVLAATLQVILVGPGGVGKRALARKLLQRYGDVPGDEDALYSDGTDFSANAHIGAAEVRVSVLRRATLESRRMMLDDVRVLRPDVLVLCCAAHAGSSFDELVAWDRALRSGFPRARVWALLDDGTSDLAGADSTGFHLSRSVNKAIGGINPAETRPRGHYLCATSSHFNIGFQSLAKDIVSIAHSARDAQLAAALAAEEAHQLAVQHAAGTLTADQTDAANLVIANNGYPAAPYVGATAQPHATSTASEHTFPIRALRSRDSSSFSLSGIVNWFSGASGDVQ